MSGRGVESWMWAHAFELLEEAERLQRRFYQPVSERRGGPVWEPPVDIFESDRELWITVALPGVVPEQVQVSTESGTLIVRARRPVPARPGPGRISRFEIPHGRFERRIELPSGRFEVHQSAMVNGCLQINLLKLT